VSRARPPAAIVIGMDSATGLQSARLFRARGVPVIGIAADPGHFGCRTRACERILISDLDGEGLLRTLDGLAASLSEKAVLVPCTDLSVLTVSRNRERLADRFHVVLADADVVEMLVDKTTFYRWAAENDLPIPGTFFLRTRFDAETAAAKLAYPCIMKPPVRTAAWTRTAPDKVIRIESADHLLRAYDRLSGTVAELMVQEWVEGSDETLWSCNCYFSRDSEPLAAFVARKIRQWPPETGTACLSVEERNDEVLETTMRLFRSVSYRGLGYLEMKRDPRTGKHYIIEPNIGRPTGRSAIAEAGGVELIYTMYCDALSRPLPESRTQTYAGVKWISLRRDALSSLWYARRGKLGLLDWWKSVRGRKAYAVWSWRDPVPFWADLAHCVEVAWKGKPKKKAAAPEARQTVS